jgi:hypothetical protein
LTLLLPLVGVADEIDRARINYEGTPGFFFKEEIGNRMLVDLKELQLSRGKEVLLREKIGFLNERLKLKDLNIKTSEDISEKWKSAHAAEYALRMSERKFYEKKLAQKDAWYRRPVFLLMTGLLIGVGLSIGVAFGINEGKS